MDKNKDWQASSSFYMEGMTVRDFIAIQVLSRLVDRNNPYRIKETADISYEYADAMLKERDK